MREILKEMDFRLTELADYLKISRPTLYKFIEYYEDERIKEMNFDIVTIFDYICKTKDVTKIGIINYILAIYSSGRGENDTLENQIISTINLSKTNKFIPQQKLQLIKNIIEKDTFDEFTDYFNFCFALKQKLIRDEEEEMLLEPLTTFAKKIKKIL